MEEPDRVANHILATLPLESWTRWQPHLEEVDLMLGNVLHEPGSTMDYGYFPVSAVISMLSDFENGSSAEIALIGNEGMVGSSIFLGDATTSHSAVVLSAGKGYRIRASVILTEFNRSPVVMGLLLCYTQALITQICQTAACNRHHLLIQQLCRLLLRIQDRLSGNDLVMTQELLAHTLGVRREGVTAAALLLQKSELIRYVRGHITVLNRSGIEDLTCECYAVVKKEYDRLLGSGTSGYGH